MYPYSLLNLYTGHTALKCQLDWNWDSDINPWSGILLWLVVQGHGTLVTPDESYQLQVGDCFTLRNTERVLGTHDSRNPVVVRAIQFDFLTQDGDVWTPSYSDLPRHRQIYPNTLLCEVMDRSLRHLEAGDTRQAAHWLCSALLLIDEVDRCPNSNTLTVKQSTQLDDLCRRIREAPETSFILADLARQFQCSEDHFIRIFRQYTQMTPVQYIIQARINEAKKLLLFTKNSVAQIADLLGYSSPYFLSRQFRQVVGVPPAVYRTGK